MQRILLTLGLTLLLTIPSQADEPHYYLKYQKHQTIEADLKFQVNCPKLIATQWQIAIMEAPELQSQQKVKTVVTPTAQALVEKTDLKRAYFRSEIQVKKPEKGSRYDLAVKYSAELYSRRLEVNTDHDKPMSVPKLRPEAQRLYLQSRGDIESDRPELTAWLKAKSLLREPKETALDYGRRVFVALRNQLEYDYAMKMDRRATSICESKKSDCGGMSMLYVAIMRNQKIPARVLFGRWATSAKVDQKLKGEQYFQWHVKAEFFADSIGWVPVDLASGVVHDQTEEGLSFFGTDAGDFFVQHIDPEIAIEFKDLGKKTMMNLQRPGWIVRGLGEIDPQVTTEDWQVRSQEK